MGRLPLPMLSLDDNHRWEILSRILINMVRRRRLDGLAFGLWRAGREVAEADAGPIARVSAVALVFRARELVVRMRLWAWAGLGFVIGGGSDDSDVGCLLMFFFFFCCTAFFVWHFFGVWDGIWSLQAFAGLV